MTSPALTTRSFAYLVTKKVHTSSTLNTTLFLATISDSIVVFVIVDGRASVPSPPSAVLFVTSSFGEIADSAVSVIENKIIIIKKKTC